MGDCGSFAVIEGQGTSKNVQGRREPGRAQSIPIRSMETHTKNKASRGTFWALGFPCWGRGTFIVGQSLGGQKS